MKLISTFFLIVGFSICSYSLQNIEKGDICFQNSQYDSANYYFDSALGSCYSCPDSTKAFILIKRGKSYQALQNFEFALIDYTNGLEIFEREKNLNGKIMTLLSIAEFYRNLHKYEKASTYLSEVSTYMDDNRVSKKNKANFYNRYAAFLTETSGNTDEIINYSEEAIKIAQEIDNKSIQASSLNEIGYIYYNLQDSRSFEYFEKSLAIYNELDNTRYSVSVIINLARNYLAINDFKSCLMYCEKGLILVNNQEWNVVKRDLYYFKYRAYYYLKNYEQSLLAIEQYYKYENIVLDLERKKSYEELEIKNKVIEKDNQILIEKEKANSFKLETEQKEREIKWIFLVTTLITIILLIALISYKKIKNSNKLLNNTLDQKEVLLQEVHHRVKNNLTLLNSLLYLRAKASDDSTLKLVLNECQSRVQAMAIIHQNLYDVEDTSVVDFKKFVEQLLLETHLLFGKEGTNKNNDIQTNGISFEMGFTIFLGLILNELITNTYKYGNDKLGTSTINISLIEKNSQYSLTYKDSGEGLPIDFDLKSSGGFGFKLIHIMLKQIDANINYSIENNKFTINFTK